VTAREPARGGYLKALIAGIAVIVLGTAGLVRGALPQSSNTSPIVVSNAWVAAPVPPTQAAAGYFTAYNSTGNPQTLLSVSTTAGVSNVLHTEQMSTQSGVVIPAHGRLALSPGSGHVMITQLVGPLQPGQAVAMQLDFANLPPVTVTATVYGPGDRP
jgi:copper(I)-binding protein